MSWRGGGGGGRGWPTIRPRPPPPARAAGADARGAGGQLTSVRTEEDEADLVLCLQFGRRDQESHDQREVRVPQGEDRASEAAHTAAQDRELAARLGRGGVGGEGGGGGGRGRMGG